MNSCEFKEIFVAEDFEVSNGILGLERDVYLSIVKFLDSSIKKSICKFFLFGFFFVFCIVHWH
jgi:hypothetical protein